MTRKFRGFAKIEVYLNESGDVVIKQDGMPAQQEDMFIYVPISKVAALVRLIEEIAAESDQQPDEEFDSHPEAAVTRGGL